MSGQHPTTLFLNDRGLRPGWSLLLFFFFLIALSFAEAPLIAHAHLLPSTLPTLLPPRLALVSELVQLIPLLLATFLTALADRRSFFSYGLSLRRALPQFALGLLTGFLALSLLVATLVLTHTLAFDGVAVHGFLAATYAAKWALVFLLVGLYEEFLFRGFLQQTTSRAFGGLIQAVAPGQPQAGVLAFWAAAILLSGLFFTAAHLGNSGETPAGIAAISLAGALFVYSLYRTGALWWAIGFHTTWDWAQSFFYGTPDSGTRSLGALLRTHPTGPVALSGGSAGPEGSLFVIPTLLLAALALRFTFRSPSPDTLDPSPCLSRIPAPNLASSPAAARTTPTTPTP